MRTDIRIVRLVQGTVQRWAVVNTNELSGSTKDETFVDNVIDCYVLKRDSSPWSELMFYS